MGISAPPAGSAPMGKPAPIRAAMASMNGANPRVSSRASRAPAPASPRNDGDARPRTALRTTANMPTAERGDFDAVQQFGNCRKSAAPVRTRCRCRPAPQQTEKQADHALPGDAPNVAETVDERNPHQGEIVAGPKLMAMFQQPGRRRWPARWWRWCRHERTLWQAVASAGPPRPALAILLPSSAVTSEALSPGVLIRMEVVEPPYMPP